MQVNCRTRWPSSPVAGRVLAKRSAENSLANLYRHDGIRLVEC